MISETTAYIICFGFVLVNIMLIWIIYLRKFRVAQKEGRDKDLYSLILQENPAEAGTTKNKYRFFDCVIDVMQSSEISKAKMDSFMQWAADQKLDIYYSRKIRSLLSLKRMEAASRLGHISSQISETALKQAFLKEKKYNVKLVIADAITNLRYTPIIPEMIYSLIGAPVWYRQKLHSILLDFGQNILIADPDLLKRTENEIQLFFCDFGGKFIAEELKQYLLDKTESIHEDIRSLAFESVLTLYPKEFMEERFLHSKDNLINVYLIKSITKVNVADDWKLIVPFLFREGTREEAVYGLSTIARQTPRVLQLLINLFHKESDNERKKIYAHILSSRIEVLFMKLLAKDKERIRKLLHEIISIGKVSDVIGFLNKNTNREIENEIVAILRGIVDTDTVIERELRIYLDKRILAKLSLEVLVEEKKRHGSKKEKNKIIILYCILVLSILILPVVYMIRRSDILSEWTFLEHFKQFVIDFNYYLVFYFVAVNAVNILILLFSVKGMNSQSRYWKMKKATFLFRKYILPSVSIIAPAYGEEATIIESTNSLLNLNYPDYEIIVVNDGSSDTTLNTLIDYFNLEKVDIHINFSLATKPVRGIYINKAFPKLVVVDKANGGKADSLNAGINISRKDFFCGIDADSLLEPDALLKVASMTLNSDKETVAAGGNIFPINGCSVDKGHISNIKIPKNTIARFQTMEYIRAFMAGRVGWAFINCLLIISGAFGLFNKKRIIEIGGYLTSSGKFGKDTVGEDMELVVRLARHMKEKKIPAKIQYAFNANCWTEVPESFNILYKQRDRWHRGLIDILTFHKKLLFNPKYKNIGMIALPYFFIFEMIGPLFEIMGYLMVIVAIILGMINTTLALLLFTATILMGIFVSLCSLLIAEKEVNYFSRKDFFILLFFSFIENIGFRQAMSFIRVIGYINSLRKPKGWGKMVRKGFSNKG